MLTVDPKYFNVIIDVGHISAPQPHNDCCKIQALVMAEVPNSLALSGSSLVVLSVLAFALEQPILSSLS